MDPDLKKITLNIYTGHNQTIFLKIILIGELMVRGSLSKMLSFREVNWCIYRLNDVRRSALKYSRQVRKWGDFQFQEDRLGGVGPGEKWMWL